jgi:D-glycero-alpha-D-manno-heptose-7-phosphate kinase
MIITRAPFRISFVGGGTDIKEFYEKYPGRVISSTIDKYVYTAINYGHLLDELVIKYSETESVKNVQDLKHGRFREALKKLNINGIGLEIASFADLPNKTGLGSSSSFSTSLIKALHAHLDKPIHRQVLAELACELEIDILNEPIGKQDQYAAAFGGLNVFQFNPDGTVEVDPVYIDYRVRADLEDHSFLFYTGTTRLASSVLTEQKASLADKFATYKEMSDSVPIFKDTLQDGDFKKLADMLNTGWERKKSLAGKISNDVLDSLYSTAIDSGAWGGKVLGAGGGGCLFFIAPPDTHKNLENKLKQKSTQLNLSGFKKIDFDFTQSGTDILFNSSPYHA